MTQKVGSNLPVVLTINSIVALPSTVLEMYVALVSKAQELIFRFVRFSTKF